VTTAALDIGAVGESARQRRFLDEAAAGRRSVALVGRTNDVRITETGEIVRLPEWLAFQAAHAQRTLIHLSRRNGGECVVPPGAGSPLEIRVPPGPLARQLGQVRTQLVREQSASAATIFCDFACQEADDPELVRALIEAPLDPALTSAGHVVIAASRTGPLPEALSGATGWAQLSMAPPDAIDRRFIIDRLDRAEPLRFGADLDAEALVRFTGGLEGDHLLRVAAHSRNLGPITRQHLNALRTAEIPRVTHGSITVAPLDAAPSAIAGLYNLKYRLEAARAADQPAGAILLVGPPGVGKTYAWLWTAGQLDQPGLKIGEARGPYVGNSERRMDEMIQAMESGAPAVVLADEADMIGFERRSTSHDSGVSDRLRARLLDVVNRAEELGITFILTSNGPTRLDPASLDRVTVLPVLHPSLSESVEIMRIAASRRFAAFDADAAHRVLAEHRGLKTGRGLLRMLAASAQFAALAGRPGRITEEDLRAASRDVVDQTVTAEHEFMALSALAATTNRTALPWVAAQWFGQSLGELPAYLDDVVRDGDLDVDRLHWRLNQLRGQGVGF